MLTIETGLAYFGGFIPEKKILLCVILFPPQRRWFYKGRLWRLTYFAKKHCFKKILQLGKIMSRENISPKEEHAKIDVGI